MGTNIMAVPSKSAADDEDTVSRPNSSKVITKKKQKPRIAPLHRVWRDIPAKRREKISRSMPPARRNLIPIRLKGSIVSKSILLNKKDALRASTTAAKRISAFFLDMISLTSQIFLDNSIRPMYL